ncbi:hypothetical protein ACHAWC_005201 [Mediolabrus comicus]
MDTLKALIVEKKRSIHKNDASTTSTTAANSSNSNNDNSKKKRKQYLTVSQRRQLQQQQQQQQQSTDSNNSDNEEESERKRKKRRKNKHNHHNSDTDSNNNDDDGQDLTALLTTKKYYDTSLLLRHKQKKGEDESDNNNDNYRRVQLEKVGDATKQKIMGDDNDDNFSKRQRLSMENDDDRNVDNDPSRSGSIGNNGTKKKNDNDVVNIPQELRQLTVDEVTTQLRNYGLPIRLFGEKVSNENNNNDDDNNNNNVDDSSRLIRLHAAIQGREATMLGISEKDEFLLDSADRTRNVFLEKDVATMSTSTNAAVAASTSVKSKEQQQQQQQQQQQNKEREQHLTEEERNDKPKRIYRYFKTLIRQWEEDLNTRSESTKHTLAGKNETKTLKQCKDYIRPLFQLCKRRELDESLQNHLFKIVMNCEEGEFVKAHDAYLDVAIGRAAWPIGVTMVGIHARSGRAKIESANVAHVMNSELQRKYLTSVKRLMSYAQRKRGDVDPSKKVVNL